MYMYIVHVYMIYMQYVHEHVLYIMYVYLKGVYALYMFVCIHRRKVNLSPKSRSWRVLIMNFELFAERQVHVYSCTCIYMQACVHV